jgi:hypothetical protein
MPGILSSLGAGLTSRGVGYGIGGYGRLGGAMYGAGQGLTRGMNYLGLGRRGQASLLGAGIGGAYGAFSDDTSVLGGMAMGAMAPVAWRAGIAGLNRGLNASIRGAGIRKSMGAGLKGAGLSLYATGAAARGYIGSTMGRAFNPIPSTIKLTSL